MKSLQEQFPKNELGAGGGESYAILPRAEVSIEAQTIYEAKLAAAALLRPKRYGQAQADADKIRRRRQYGRLSQRNSV